MVGKSGSRTNSNDEQNLHRKLEKELSVQVSGVREQLFEAGEVQGGYTEQPSGAFVSLTVGK